MEYDTSYRQRHQAPGPDLEELTTVRMDQLGTEHDQTMRRAETPQAVPSTVQNWHTATPSRIGQPWTARSSVESGASGCNAHQSG